MELKDLPKIKGSKAKIKKTFNISKEAIEVYEKAKEYHDIDTPGMCTQAIEKAMLSIKHLINK
jgi:hypothetical protein